MSLIYKSLSEQVKYQHDIDAYQQTKATKHIEKQTIRKLSPIRIRPTSLSVQRHKKQIAYNKWYINPEYQFKQFSKNPKDDKKMLKDQNYVYKNLRNPQFWNWVHPFETGKLPTLKTPNNLQKIDPKVLDGFKKFIAETHTQKRLPSIVQYVLEHNKNKTATDKQ